MITTDKIFADNQTAIATMKGLYITIQNQFGLLNGQTSKLAGLYCNEIERTTSVPEDLVFWSNSLNSDDGTLPGIWSTTYSYIYHLNEIIEKVPKAAGVSDSLRIQLTAEAKFMRSLFYFYLVNCFGGVPLVTTPDYEKNAYTLRIPIPAVYHMIIDDLLDAESKLPAAYIPNSSFPSTRLRPCKLTATALLARIYLYQNDWTNAEAKATAVINAGIYSLTNDLNSTFLPASEEVILHFMPAQSLFNTGEGAYFIPSSSASEPGFVLADHLMNQFEPGDLRKTCWTKQTKINGKDAWYPYKYKVYQQPPPYVEYNIILRLAEQYLIRSEALAQQDRLAEAINDLNTIRKRANLPALSVSIDKTTVLAAIEQERQVELFAEWGHRWFDLTRWPSRNEPNNPLLKRADDILSVIQNGTWQAYKKLWPIPGIEIQRNINLKQNEGY